MHQTVEKLSKTWTWPELTSVCWCHGCWQKQRWTMTWEDGAVSQCRRFNQSVSILLIFWRLVCHCCTRLTGCLAHRRWTPGRAPLNRGPWTWCVICTNQTRGPDSTPNSSFSDLNSLWVILRPIFHRETLQLSVGPLLHIMLNNIEEKVQGTSSEPNRLEHWDDHTPLCLHGLIFTLSHTESYFCTLHMTPLWCPVWWLWVFLTWDGLRMQPI